MVGTRYKVIPDSRSVQKKHDRHANVLDNDVMGKTQQRKFLLTSHRSPATLGGVDGGWAEGESGQGQEEGSGKNCEWHVKWNLNNKLQ